MLLQIATQRSSAGRYRRGMGMAASRASVCRVPDQRRHLAHVSAARRSVGSGHGSWRSTMTTPMHVDAKSTARRRRPSCRKAASLCGNREHHRAAGACRFVRSGIHDLLRDALGLDGGAVHSAVLQLDAGRRSADRRGVPARPAVDGDDPRDHRRRRADPHLQRRLHARRSGLSAVLRVPQSVRLLHAGAGARRQLSGAVRRLGRASDSARTC